MADEQRYAGLVEKWIDQRGFGFIRPDDIERSVFVHARDIKSGHGRRTLVAGQVVEFEIGTDSQGRWQCENLVVVEQAAT